MTRLTLYTTLITGSLAFAAATFWLQAQPEISDTEYVSIWANLSTAEKTDAVAMIASAPKGTANTFDYYKNLIDRNADTIPSAINHAGQKVSTIPNVTENSLYKQLTRARQGIEADGEGVYSLIDSITRAENSLQKDTLYEMHGTLDLIVFQAMQSIANRWESPRNNLQDAIITLLYRIGIDGDFGSKETVYDKLVLARTKLNEKTGKPKPTIEQALNELDKMSLGECEQYKKLVDARSATNTLQEAINAVNGRPTNKTYGLLGNIKTTPAGHTSLAEHDIYLRLAQGIAHLNTLLAARDSGTWPDYLENLEALINAIPNIPHTTESNGGGG